MRSNGWTAWASTLLSEWRSIRERWMWMGPPEGTLYIGPARTFVVSAPSNPVMKRFLFAFAPFALVTLAVVGLQAAIRETEHVSRTIKLTPGGTLSLKSFSGRVNITGWNRDEVAIEADRRASR